jgi:hypothetical protein
MTVLTLSSFPPAGLVERLHERGLHTQLRVGEAGVGPDPRLHIRSPRAAVRVELLGPLAGLRDGPVWQAVRVADGHRAVWCGPPRTCTDGVLCRFVSDLIELSTDELLGWWQRLG